MIRMLTGVFLGVISIMTVHGCVGVTLKIPPEDQMTDKDVACIVALARLKAPAGKPDYFGEASDNVKAYTRFWQEHFRRKREENRNQQQADEGQWFRHVGEAPEQWLSRQAFQESLNHLHEAVTQELKAKPRERIQRLILRHRNAVLTYRALRAEKGKATEEKDADEEKSPSERKRLNEFRERFKEHL